MKKTKKERTHNCRLMLQLQIIQVKNYSYIGYVFESEEKSILTVPICKLTFKLKSTRICIWKRVYNTIIRLLQIFNIQIG